MPVDRKARRINGLSRPFSSTQIAAWIALITSILQFVIFVSPILPLIASIPVTIVFMICCGGVLYYGVQTLRIDPIDVHLYKHLKNAVQNENDNQCSIDNDDDRQRRKPTSFEAGDNEQEQRQDDHEVYTFEDGQVHEKTSSHDTNDDSPVKTTRTKNRSAAAGAATMMCCSEHQLNPFLLSHPNDEMKQCWICDTQVAKHSMHCKFCNKCVYKFDHHCMCKYTKSKQHVCH